MEIVEWFKGLWKTDKANEITLLANYASSAHNKAYLKTLAVSACIKLISRSIARCEFLNIDKGKELRNANYYKLNIEPNPNQSAGKFWQEVLTRLILNNKCLVIQNSGSYYIAEDYDIKSKGLSERSYESVTVNGKKLNRVFREKEVFHFELYGDSIKQELDSLYKTYGEMIGSVERLMLAQGKRKYVLNIPTSYPKTKDASDRLESLFTKHFKNFFDNDKDTVLPLTNELKVEDVSAKNADSKAGIANIGELTDMTFKYTAIAFGVPPKLLMGDVADTDEAVNNLITFSINPIAEILTDEINRKLYGKARYLEKTYIKLDTSKIKYVDITKVAGSLDVLTRIGAYSINDSLRLLGKEELDEDWAKKRYITKNYETAERRMADEV